MNIVCRVPCVVCAGLDSLFMQGSPFNMVSSDRHYKMPKLMLYQHQRICTSMSTFLETQTGMQSPPVFFNMY